MRAAVVTMALTAAAAGDVVVERWGIEGRLQHPGTLTYVDLGREGVAMRFDLSELPEGTKVHRARLLIERPGRYASAFDIVAARRSDDGTIRPAGRALRLLGPDYRAFDATEAVAEAVSSGATEALLLVRSAPGYDRRGTMLEIACQGRLRQRVRQVSGVKAFCRGGQVFVTFNEIADLASGKADLPWSVLKSKAEEITPYEVIPKDPNGQSLRYRVYRSEKPIDRRTIAQAELIGEIAGGSAYNTRIVSPGWERKSDPPVLRVAVEDGVPLPPGVGVFVRTIARPGKAYYAVVTAADGVENTIDVGPDNTTGPVEERPGRPEPVMYLELKADLKGTTYLQRWYSLWAGPQLAPTPCRHDVTVEMCPDLLDRRPPLWVVRGHAWGINPEPGRPGPIRDVRVSHSEDEPNSFWMGLNDAAGTLKGIEQGRFQPFVQRRQEEIIRWAQQQWRTDPNRIYCGIGAWGMMEIERGSLYAYLVGWGQPEVTKGFVCWNQAVAAWGPPEVYAGHAPAHNPYIRQDYGRFVRENPERELPYFLLQAGWGMHLTEMGWPPFPRFLRAMTDTRRAFAASWDQTSPWGWRATPVHRAIGAGDIVIRKDRPLPAFGNCSLDDNPGDGKLGAGDLNGQINGYLLWDSQSIVDRPDGFEITVRLDGSAPRDECTVDLTPRRCRGFRPEPGRACRFTNVLTTDERTRTIQVDRAAAGKLGLVTLRRVVIGKNKHRIRIELLPQEAGK